MKKNFQDFIIKENIEILTFKNCVISRFNINDYYRKRYSNKSFQIIKNNYEDLTKSIKRAYYSASYVDPFKVVLGFFILLFGFGFFLALTIFSIQDDSGFGWIIVAGLATLGFLYWIVDLIKTTQLYWRYIFSKSLVTNDYINEYASKFKADFTEQQILNSHLISIDYDDNEITQN